MRGKRTNAVFDASEEEGLDGHAVLGLRGEGLPLGVELQNGARPDACVLCEGEYDFFFLFYIKFEGNGG